MTFAAIAFSNGTPAADLVKDSDLLKLHPDMANNRWRNLDTYRSALVESFEKVLFDLKNIGLNQPYIDASAANLVWFKRVVIYQALMMIFRDFRAERGDRWDLLIEEYQRQYDLALKAPTLDYDTAAETAATATETTKTCEIRLLR